MELAIFDVALDCSVVGYVWHKLSFFFFYVMLNLHMWLSTLTGHLVSVLKVSEL
jgi:hypothetical protein